MEHDLTDLPIGEFAFPGPLRDQLVAAILDGSKTATSSLVIEYRDEPLPEAGKREVVVDSDNRPVAIIETTHVTVGRLADVSDDFARAEGEGFAGHAEWRVGHERFWHSADMRAYLNDPAFAVDDDTQVVQERFRLVAAL